jgi:fatty-acyl-CoA synthase
VLRELDAAPGRHDTSTLRAVLVGGAAAAAALIRAYDRHGIRIVHTWGMTELCMGLISELPAGLRTLPPDAQLAHRKRQGVPLPLLEVRARAEDGDEIAWDGATMGELEVRGPWVAGAYADASAEESPWTADGWFATGDIVTIDERSAVELQDRAKDLVKSGGEWISSSALESALLSHPGVAEAAVIAVPDPHWTERPLAIVVASEHGLSAEDLRAHLRGRVAKWWIPERFEFVDAIPRTAVGKLDKRALRGTYTA